MTERWKIITEAPRYKVSNMGNVYSLINNKPKLAFPDSKGYLRVQLYIKPGVAITRKVHRLVAQHYIKNPHNLPQVNHKDANKINNTVDNLEWCNQRYNMSHAVINNLHSKRKDLVIILPQIVSALSKGYLISDIAKYYSTTSKTIRSLIIKHNPSPKPITNLKVGRKSNHVYFDKTRNKWRSDVKRFGINDKQFNTFEEACLYVEQVYFRGKKND